MKRFLAIGCLMLLASNIIVGQVSFPEEVVQSSIIGDGAKILQKQSPQTLKKSYVLSFSRCKDEYYHCYASVFLGDSKEEALSRLKDIKDACATGKDFAYYDSKKRQFLFTFRGDNIYSCFIELPAYFNINCLDRAIRWLQNIDG